MFLKCHFFAIVFMIFFYSYDRYLWKLKFSKIPNLSGKWNGRIKTSYGKGEEIDVEVNIKQTWSSISIVLKTSNSKSKSKTASISLSEARLVYQYFNEPLSSSVATLHKHYGVTFLDFDEIDRLEGSYFTCKDRQTHGEIFLERKK
uniref:Cap15 family cyclic dinucleotide receptor domain-containing protein n=1 Tax=Methanosarcina barkeri TaxID=2208 RepID=UPI00373FCA6D